MLQYVVYPISSITKLYHPASSTHATIEEAREVASARASEWDVSHVVVREDGAKREIVGRYTIC